MIIVVIVGIGMLVGAILGYYADKYSFMRAENAVTGGLGGSLVGLIAAFILSALIISLSPKEWVETNRLDMVALSDHSTLSGQSHFLGSGYIGATRTYDFRYKVSSTGSKSFSVDQSVATVYQDSSVAFAKRFELYPVTRWHQHFMLGYTPAVSWEFHVPSGSVIEDSFRLDLK